MTGEFQVQFIENVAEFLDNLDGKAREKICYNIQKARFINDKDLFKKFKVEIWEFRTLFNKKNY